MPSHKTTLILYGMVANVNELNRTNDIEYKNKYMGLTISEYAGHYLGGLPLRQNHWFIVIEYKFEPLLRSLKDPA